MNEELNGELEEILKILSQAQLDLNYAKERYSLDKNLLGSCNLLEISIEKIKILMLHDKKIIKKY